MLYLRSSPALALGVALVAGLSLTLPMGTAFHFHTGCLHEAGNLGDAPTATGATVTVLQDSYLDSATLSPVTLISAGESVTWTWHASNPYCHSVTGTDWESPGFPGGRLVPTGAESSLPLLIVSGGEFWPDPTNPPGAALSYTRVFAAPGTYQYVCNEHTLIGMRGVVVVQ